MSSRSADIACRYGFAGQGHVADSFAAGYGLSAGDLRALARGPRPRARRGRAR